MTNEEKQALIEYCERVLKGSNNNSPMEQVYKIALAALTAQPVVSPYEWVHIRFTDRSKNQMMKCQIAWSDWLNSVIYDEEGAPLLISNSAFQVIRAAGYQVEGE